jgi:hypothetical protein
LVKGRTTGKRSFRPLVAAAPDVNALGLTDEIVPQLRSNKRGGNFVPKASVEQVAPLLAARAKSCAFQSGQRRFGKPAALEKARGRGRILPRPQSGLVVSNATERHARRARDACRAFRTKVVRQSPTTSDPLAFRPRRRGICRRRVSIVSPRRRGRRRHRYTPPEAGAGSFGAHK